MILFDFSHAQLQESNSRVMLGSIQSMLSSVTFFLVAFDVAEKFYLPFSQVSVITAEIIMGKDLEREAV